MDDPVVMGEAFETALLPQRMRLLFDAARPPRSQRAALLGWDGSLIGSVEPELGEAMWRAGLPLRTGRPRVPLAQAARPTVGLPGIASVPFEVIDPRLESWQLVAAGVGDSSSQALALLAQWLAEEGHGGRWRNEPLAVPDAHGRLHGVVERGVVRTLGITTTAVHLIGYTSDGDQWVQQRALDKATDPGLWDTLMGGQCGAGETTEESLRRETWEEAGLHLDHLHRRRHTGHLMFRRPVEEGYLVERIDLFEAVVPESLQPENRDGEVARFERVTPQAAAEQIAQGLFTLEAALMMARAVG